MTVAEKHLAWALSSTTPMVDSTHLAKLVTANPHDSPPNPKQETVFEHEIAVVEETSWELFLTEPNSCLLEKHSGWVAGSESPTGANIAG